MLAEANIKAGIKHERFRDGRASVYYEQRCWRHSTSTTGEDNEWMRNVVRK
jgi:hypothetical protein